MHHAHNLKIYKKRWHIAVTFLVIILPLLFIFFLAPLTGSTPAQVLKDLSVSLVRVLVAYVISLIIAILFAVLLGHGKIGNFFLPVFDVLQSFPSFALLPILILWFGRTNTSVIIFLVLAIIWPILFAVISAIRTVRDDLAEAAFIFGARGWKKLFYFTVPSAFPGIIIGSVVGIGEGWDAIVGAEIIAAAGGIGGFLNTASARGDVSTLSFGIMAVLLLIFSMNKIIWLPLLRRSHDYSHE